jgi:hypothetical protein
MAKWISLAGCRVGLAVMKAGLTTTRKIPLSVSLAKYQCAESAEAKEAGEFAENAPLIIQMSNGSHNRPRDPPRPDPPSSATDRYSAAQHARAPRDGPRDRRFSLTDRVRRCKLSVMVMKTETKMISVRLESWMVRYIDRLSKELHATRTYTISSMLREVISDGQAARKGSKA